MTQSEAKAQLLVIIKSQGAQETINQIKSLNTAVNQQMGEAAKMAGVSMGGFSQTLRNVGASLTQAGAQLGQWGDALITSGKNTQWLGRQFLYNVSLPLIAIGTVATKAALDFSQSMAWVAAAAGTTTSETDADFMLMKNAAETMGRTTLFSSQEAAKGLYEFVSAGFSAAEAAKQLPIAVKFAEAAQLDLGDATQFSSQMLHIWERKGYDLTKIMDIVSVSVQKSQAHFSDFTHNIEQSAAFADVAGVSFEDLSSAMMVMADRGVPAARAGFNLRQALSQMINPSNQAQEILQKLNITYWDAQGKLKPFPTILNDIRKSTMGMTDEEKSNTLAKLFNVRAGSAMLSLLQGTDEEYQRYVDIVNNASGATNEMAGTMEQSSFGQFKITMNQIKQSIIDFGEAILPTIIPMMQKLGEVIRNVTKWFSELSDEKKAFIVKIGLAVIAIGPLLIALGMLKEGLGLVFKGTQYALQGLGSLITMLGNLKKATSAIQMSGLTSQITNSTSAITGWGTSTATTATATKGLFAGLSGSLGPLLLAIGAVIASLGSMYVAFKDNFWGIKDKFLEATSSLRQAWSEFVKTLDEALAPLGGLKVVLGYVWQGFLFLVKVIGFVLSLPIAGFIKGLAEVIQLLTIEIRLVNSAVVWLANKLGEIVGKFQVFISNVTNAGRAIKEWFLDKIELLITKISDGIKSVLLFGEAFKKHITDKLGETIINIEKFVKSVQDKLLNFLGLSPEHFGYSVFRDNVKKALDGVLNYIDQNFVIPARKKLASFLGIEEKDFGDINKVLQGLKGALTKIRDAMWKEIQSFFLKGEGNPFAEIGEWARKGLSQINWFSVLKIISGPFGMAWNAGTWIGEFSMTPLGKKIGEALGKINWFSVLKVVSGPFGMAWNLGEWMGGINWNIVGRKLKETFSKINWKDVLKVITGPFGMAWNLGEWFGGLNWKSIGTKIKEFFAKINWGEVLLSLTGPIGQAWKLGEFFGNLFEVKRPEIEKAGEKIPDAVGKGATNEQSKLKLITQIGFLLGQIAAMALPYALAGFLSVGWEVVKGIGQGIAQLFGDLWNKGKEALGNVINGIGSSIGDAWNKGAEIASNVAQGIVGWLENLYNKGREVAIKIKDGIWSIAGEMWDAGAGLIKNLIAGLESKLNNMSGAVKSAWDIIVNYLHQSYNPLLPAEKWGGELIDNYVTGLKKGMPLLNNQLSSLSGANINVGNSPLQGRGTASSNTYEINYNLNPGVIIASPGELREFKRKMNDMEKQEQRRIAI
jgi:TP901 family phage tail tape measure protein